MEDNTFSIDFFGVRGSFPRTSRSMSRFGGNTSCIRMTIGETVLIFDCGSGLYELGLELDSKNHPVDAHIFLTHLHWDHIHGLPMFKPFYNPKNIFSIYGEDKAGSTLEDSIKKLMAPPYFPVCWDDLASENRFISIGPGDIINPADGISVSTLRLNHPDGSIGYRIDSGGKSCCYITDNEHVDEMDCRIIEFARNCDLLIYDSNFTKEEYESRKGWGHSTWEKAVDIAIRSDSKSLALFHHDVNRSDEDVLKIESQAVKLFKNSIASYEGLSLQL